MRTCRDTRHLVTQGVFNYHYPVVRFDRRGVFFLKLFSNFNLAYLSFYQIQLLGELYADKQYLENLLNDKGMKICFMIKV